MLVERCWGLPLDGNPTKSNVELNLEIKQIQIYVAYICVSFPSLILAYIKQLLNKHWT